MADRAQSADESELREVVAGQRVPHEVGRDRSQYRRKQAEIDKDRQRRFGRRQPLDQGRRERRQKGGEQPDHGGHVQCPAIGPDHHQYADKAGNSGEPPPPHLFAEQEDGG